MFFLQVTIILVLLWVGELVIWQRSRFLEEAEQLDYQRLKLGLVLKFPKFTFLGTIAPVFSM